MTLEADLEDPANYMVEFGIGYANNSSLSDMTELKAALPFGSAIGAPFDVSSFNTGFVVLNINGSNPSAFTANKLTITFDDSVPQLYAMDMDPASEAAGYLETHLIAWEEGDNTVENPDDNSEEIIDEYQLLLEKLEDPNVIMSDIVAGIDHSSIIKDGDTTFFSSVMSDGSVVRFEGTHIDVDESGIRFYSDSELTSLDALGKIYAYYPVVENYANYSNSELLCWGYGYTYSASKTSVERAYEVHTFGTNE